MAMKTHRITVWLSLVVVTGLLLGIKDATAMGPELGVTSPFASEEDQARLDELEEQVSALRSHLQDHQKKLEAIRNPTLEDADKRIAIIQGEIKRVQEDKSLQEPVLAAAKNRLLERYRRELDHYMVARSKLNPNGSVDSAGRLDETNLYKYEVARALQIEEELKKKVQELLALTNSLAAKLPQPAKQPPQPAKQPPQPAKQTAKLQVPNDGEYKLTIRGGDQLGDVASMIWKNREDGSASVTIIFEQASLVGAVLNQAGYQLVHTLDAVVSDRRKAYVVGGDDFQEFAQMIAPPTDPDIEVTNLRSNARFIVTSEGQNLVLNFEGKVSWTQMVPNHPDPEMRGPRNKSEPQMKVTLIGTPVQ
jgi:hypothetical protein